MSDLEGFELSPQQKRLWPFLALRSDSPYRAQTAVLLEGTLAREVLLASLRSLLERHEILRTRFRKLSEMNLPLQVVGEADGSLSLRDVDLTGLDPGELEAALTSLLAEERQAPLDPEQGPVVRVVLAPLEAAQTVLILTMSALCADGPSLSNLVRELADAYARGGELEADEAPQYADLAAWQNEIVELDEASAGRTYWRQQRLENGLATELPFEREVEEPGPFRPAVFAWRIAPRLSREMEALAADMGVPLEDVLLAAWCVLLARHAGGPALPVGVLGDGRNYETLERAVGPLARYLLVRFEPAAGTTFRSAVETLASLRRKALDYQEFFSWETLNGAHGPQPPHFQLCFDFQPASEEHAAPGLRFSVLRQAACIEPCRLRLSCSADREGISVELHYHGGAFQPSDIETLAERFTALLTSAAENPGEPIRALAMVGPSEQDRLAALNETAVDLPEDVRLERLFERQVERSPEAVAVVLGKRGLTYAELESRAASLAKHLRRLGVGPEVIVPLCVERSFEMLIGLLGILKAGGAYLPLDPGLPAERLSRLLDEIDAPVLLTRSHELAALPPLRCPVVRLDEELPKPAEEEAPEPASYSPDHAAYIIYTSGSTGTPKGILVSHRAICNRLLWMERSGLVGSADILLQRTRFTFDASIWEIFLPLWLGARLVLLPQEAQADASRVAQLIREEEVTVLQVVPSLLRVLLEEEDFCRCTSLLRVFSGGEALSGDLARRFAECLPKVALVNLYGPTEAAIDATFQPCGSAPERARVPIGRPLPNVQVYVVDAAIQQVPVGVLGELCIGGAGLARGYARRADLTAERFIPNPFGNLPGARLYRTGDLARLLPDGSLDFLGRRDRQVKLRGYRIELDEIEAVLRQHPDVLQVAVVLRDDVPGQQRLVAYVEGVQRTDTPLASAGELRDFAAARLPEYMVPAAIARLQKLPLLPNGKLDRSALPPPESVQPKTPKEAVAPRNRVEGCLAAIWCDLLHLDRVSIHDNFFELGGDSILSIQVVARAKREGIVLVARDLFRHQTIAELAQAQGTAAHDAGAERSGGFFALSPAQRQFFELDLPEPHHFNQALLLSVGEPIPLPLLTTVVAAVVSHHEALRLRFEPGAEGWLQQVSAPEDPPVSCLDLSSLPEPLRSGAVERAALAVQQSLDFSKGPVFRVVQLDLGTLGSRLLLLAHHLVVDGVSWRILLEDFALLQEQIQLGKPPELPLPTTSFRSWIERLIHHVDTGALAQEIPYWMALSEASAAPLPIDLGDGENTFGSEQTVSVALEPGETRILLQETLAAFRAQINDVLLTALARTFTAWTGGASLLVDIEGHGREELFEDVDLSRTVGWFTSQFPALLDLADADGPEAALNQVKEQLRRVPNRGIGYLLLRHLSRSPELAARIRTLPKSQVSFNYLGQLDQSLPLSSRLSLASEDKGREIAPSAKRPFLIDVIGVVAGGQLRLQWTYSAHRHRMATIAALSERFLAELRALIERSRSAHTESYVPSEFPLAGLDRNRLGRLSSLIDRLDATAEEGEPLDA